MKISRTVTMLALTMALAAAGRVFAGEYGSLRIEDDGGFQVWNGIDAEARGERTGILAVIGAHKSMQVHYAPGGPAPTVRFGPDWAEIFPGEGMSLLFSPEPDCRKGLILLCTNRPIKGIPKGTIMCMCTAGQPDNECCASDTGFYKDHLWMGMIP